MPVMPLGMPLARYHISNCPDEKTCESDLNVNEIIAFDGKRILFTCSLGLRLISLIDNKQIGKYLTFCDDYWKYIWETSNNTTSIVPTTIIGRIHMACGNEQKSKIYDLGSGLHVIPQFEHSRSNMEPSDINSLSGMSGCLGSQYGALRNLWKSGEYYYVITAEEYLGIFKKVGGSFVLEWSDKLLGKIHHFIRTVTILDVPENCERWKEFQNEIFEYLQDYTNLNLSNIITSYI